MLSEKLIGKLIKPYAAEMRENECTLTRKNVHDAISRSKGKGFDPDAHVKDLLSRIYKHLPPQKRTEDALSYGERLIVRDWREYEVELRKSNLVDFDDLLLFGVRLVKGQKKVVKWCRHVLVDELYVDGWVLCDAIADSAQPRYEFAPVSAHAVYRCGP